MLGLEEEQVVELSGDNSKYEVNVRYLIYEITRSFEFELKAKTCNLCSNLCQARET